MTGKAAGLLMLVLINTVLVNSEDEISNAHSTPLWTELFTGSPPANRQSNTQPEEKSTPVADEVKFDTEDGELTTSTSAEFVTPTWTRDGASTFPLTLPSRGLDQCQIYTIIVMGVTPMLIALPGIFGNAICMLVFWEDRSKSATNTLLLALSVSDTGLLVTWPVIMMAQVLYYNVDHVNLTQHFLMSFPYMRKFYWGLSNIFQFMGAWLMVVITGQRYVAVCHPHKMRFLGQPRVAWIVIGIIATISIAFMVPRFFELDVWEDEDGRVRMANSWLAENASFQLYYKLLGHYTLIFIIPVTLLVFFTVELIRTIKKSMKVKNSKTVTVATTGDAAKDQSKSKTDEITFALVVVDIVFIICQTMNPLRRLLDLAGFPYRNCESSYAYFRVLSPVLTTFNSAINFVIFVLCGKGFRAKVFERLCGKKNEVGVHSMGGSTQKTTVRSTNA